MQELILSVLSLIILVPLIYFLPLGLTNKGKALLLEQLLLANIGLLTQHILPTWLIWTISRAARLLVAYVMQNRMSEVLFAGMSEDSGTKDSLYDQNLMPLMKETAFISDMIHTARNPSSLAGQWKTSGRRLYPNSKRKTLLLRTNIPGKKALKWKRLHLKNLMISLLLKKAKLSANFPVKIWQRHLRMNNCWSPVKAGMRMPLASRPISAG